MPAAWGRSRTGAPAIHERHPHADRRAVRSAAYRRHLLAATGRPYDTLEGVIGIGDAGKGCGTLREFGVNYDECPLLPDFTPDYDLIAEKARTATVVHIQRSRGYTQRNAFDLATIQKVADTARKANPNAVIFVDNCYGEFTQTAEPVAFGADIMAGSFIKNPGGGITPTGGYIAGRKDLVEKCSHRFTAPGIGGDWAARRTACGIPSSASTTRRASSARR